MTRDDDPVLSPADHRRDSAGLVYVYPVVSRRAGGVSVGINLNVNNACNWRCIYCQVPGLTRGAPPPVDLVRLEDELRVFLTDVLRGDFLARRVPEHARRLVDLALSGNGEPTSAREFDRVVEAIARVRAAVPVPAGVKTVLITNGSLVHRAEVQAGLRAMAPMHGEVWFKVDRATEAGMRAVNDVQTSMAHVRRNLETAARLCPTWIQTCMFALDGAPPSDVEVEAYLRFLAALRADAVPVRGVLLYGLARPSTQPEAPRLSRVPDAWLEALGGRIAALGLTVRTTP